LFAAILIGRGLNELSEPVLLIFSDRNKPERLQGTGDRRQHFCCAEHCPRVRQEHQFGVRALIQKVRQVQQSAGDGNDLQLASSAESVLEAKDNRSRVRKLQSRWSR
jgi:hypothetical protein